MHVLTNIGNYMCESVKDVNIKELHLKIYN